MAKSKPTIPFVRVTAPSADYAITCAGARWAGVSEIPRATLTQRELDELKLDARLQVEEFDREAPADQAAAA